MLKHELKTLGKRCLTNLMQKPLTPKSIEMGLLNGWLEHNI